MVLSNMLGFEPEPRTDRAPRAWPKYMTARVAADYSDSSPWTVRRHVRPCGRRGRTFVYSIEAVEEWMRGVMATAQRNETPRSVTRPARSHARRDDRDRATVPDNRSASVEASRDGVAA